MNPQSTLPILARHDFTEVTKSRVSCIAWETAIAIGYVPPAKEGEENNHPRISFEQKEALLDQLEKRLRSEILTHCDPSNPIAWTTSVITRLIMARLRLSLYHPPLHDNRSASHQHVPRDLVLLAAIQNMDCGHLLDTDPAAAPWRWYFKTYVQWHSLAAALAELCVQDRCPLVERAWKIVDVVFDDWAARIADSRSGMLWRPIQKLMDKAQAKRNESMSNNFNHTPQQQQPLPQFGTLAFSQFQPSDPTPNWTSQAPVLDMNQSLMQIQSFGVDQSLSPDAFASLNVNETMDTINWAQWDEFMNDFQMSDMPNTENASGLDEDVSLLGAWW